MLAIIGASAALSISKIPFMGPIGACRLGRIDGQFVINPTHEQIDRSDLNVLVGGGRQAINMLEVGAKQLSEDVVAEGIAKGHEACRQVIEMIDELQQKVGVPKENPAIPMDEELYGKVKDQLWESSAS